MKFVNLSIYFFFAEKMVVMYRIMTQNVLRLAQLEKRGGKSKEMNKKPLFFSLADKKYI